MRKRTLLSAAIAFVALAVSIAGITAGTADAKPRELNCLQIGRNIDQSYNLAIRAKAQGDQAGYNQWMDLYHRGQEKYDRYCLT